MARIKHFKVKRHGREHFFKTTRRGDVAKYFGLSPSTVNYNSSLILYEQRNVIDKDKYLDLTKFSFKDKGLLELNKIMDKMAKIEHESGLRHIWVRGHHYLEDLKTGERTCIDKYYGCELDKKGKKWL